MVQKWIDKESNNQTELCKACVYPSTTVCACLSDYECDVCLSLQPHIIFLSPLRHEHARLVRTQHSSITGQSMTVCE